MTSRTRTARLALSAPALALLVVSAVVASPTAAKAGVPHRPIAVAAAGKSTNWFGYNQGVLEKGGPFSSIAGDWNVPTATRRISGQAENSSTWVGIGGGCLDTACTATDNTLIQAGTEQDVSSAGKASYYAWWEVIPAPSMQITTMTVAAGDHMHVAIGQLAPDVWTISVSDLTRHATFSQTAPYSSTEATAEWIEEAPTLIGTSGATEAALPKLTTVHFSHLQANGAGALIVRAEEIQLVNSSGKVIGAPSPPDSDRDEFNDCTWAGSCWAPSS